MADEELVVGTARTDPLFLGQSRAVEAGAAKVAVSPDKDAVARRRKPEAADVAREAAHLHGGSAHGLPEELVVVADCHQEPQRAVGPEHRVVPLLCALNGDG